MIALSKIRALSVIAGLLAVVNVSGQIVFPEIENWEKSPHPKIYDEETLWEYINGAAEYYLNYGFSRLEVTEYAVSDEQYIKAEIYVHASPLNAFGIYAYERPEKGEFLDVGIEGYQAHSALNFYGDNFYVKVHSNQNDEQTLKAIKEIADGIAKGNILGKDEVTSVLSVFPDKNKLLHSEKYYPRNYMGYEFLHSALEISYKVGDDTFKLFVLNGANNEEATKMLRDYFAFTKTDKKPAPGVIYEIEDMFNGWVLIAQKKSQLFGVYDVPDKKLARNYLEQLFK